VKIDDDDLVLLVDLFANANEAVGLKGQCLRASSQSVLRSGTMTRRTHPKRDGSGLNANTGQLQVLAERNRLLGLHGERMCRLKPANLAEREEGEGALAVFTFGQDVWRGGAV
jgi:hypothetical protein